MTIERHELKNNSVILMNNFSNLTLDNNDEHIDDCNYHKSDSTFIYRDESFPQLISDNVEPEKKELKIK